MRRMIALRLAYAIGSLIVVSIVVFIATQALPGSAAVARLGRNATPTAVESFLKLHHLDDPLWLQYSHWIANLLRGQLGDSLLTGYPVASLIGAAIKNSLVLLVAVAVIAIPLSTALGIVAAIRRNRIADRISSVLVQTVSALPEFVICLVLVLFLATNVFQWLPAVSPVDPSRPILDQLNLLVLPTLALVVLVLPYVTLTLRSCMIDALESQYVMMARLRGVPEWRVILCNALPNVAGPTFQVIAQSLAYLAGGIVVVETVFQFPGVGQAFASAVRSHDLPVIQTLTVTLAAFYILTNLVADAGTVAMTPTMRRRPR